MVCVLLDVVVDVDAVVIVGEVDVDDVVLVAVVVELLVVDDVGLSNLYRASTPNEAKSRLPPSHAQHAVDAFMPGVEQSP